MSCGDVAWGLGAHYNTVSRWLSKGRLKGERVGEGTGDWLIAEKAVRQFVMDYTAHVDLAKADKFWLVDILCPAGAKRANGEDRE